MNTCRASCDITRMNQEIIKYNQPLEIESFWIHF